MAKKSNSKTSTRVPPSRIRLTVSQNTEDAYGGDIIKKLPKAYGLSCL